MLPQSSSDGPTVDIIADQRSGVDPNGPEWAWQRFETRPKDCRTPALAAETRPALGAAGVVSDRADRLD